MPKYPNNWQEISSKTKQAAEWTCAHCSIKQGENPRNNITVHHLDYDTFNNKPSNLITLCQKCHLRLQASQSILMRSVAYKRRLLENGQIYFPLLAQN